MIESLKSYKVDHIIFLHSKGVTCPGIRPGKNSFSQYKKILSFLNLSLTQEDLNFLCDAVMHESIVGYIYICGKRL